MTQNSRKKICILVDCLSKGGAEKAAGILSKLLHSSAKYQVTIISLRDDISYPYAGTLINLGKKEFKFKPLKQIQKFLRLRKYIKEINADYIIDFRTRRRILMEGLLHRFIWQPEKMIYTIHSSNINWHIPQGNFFVPYYKKGKIVAVSKSIKKILEDSYGYNNVSYIPNTVNSEFIKKQASIPFEIKDKYILAVGGLRNDIKQFDKLIETYAKTNLLENDIKLYVLGDGPDRIRLENLIEKLNLKDHVKLHGFKNNPYPYLKHSLFLVLCSKVEGLPMVILEALTLNTPVVSFDLKSGPSELIAHNKNGILVSNQDFKSLKTTIEYLVNNKEVLTRFKENTNKDLQVYSQENHLKNWCNLLK